MKDDSASEAIGKKALLELECLVVNGWGRLSSSDKQQIEAFSPERFMLRIRSDLRRLSSEPLMRVPRQTVSQRHKEDSRLVHLRPGGPAAQRERRRLSSRELLLGRPLDDRASALAYNNRNSFDLRQLRAQRNTVIKLRTELRYVQQTALYEHVMRQSPKWKRAIEEASRNLVWLQRFLTKFIRAAK